MPMRIGNHFITPFTLPVAAFVAAIGIGSLFLSLDIAHSGEPVAYVDALFTATSAVCVTGLASVDVFTVFNRAGQCCVLFLIQLGGIGIITYTTLVFYMLSRRISLRDRLAVRQGLSYDPGFALGCFLQRMVLSIFLFEALGAAALFYCEPERIGLFNAVFLAVSAFCNAGFAPWQDSLVQFRGDLGVNVSIMTLIFIGGLGFFVINDVARVAKCRVLTLAGRMLGRDGEFFRTGTGERKRLAFFSRVVLSTSFFLLITGTVAIFIVELGNVAWRTMPFSERFLAAMFQSVTSRTAGFASVDMASFSEITLFITIILMFIGGSPGSCAGGIKTTSFRILFGSLAANLRGRSQVVVKGRAMDAATRNSAVLLISYSLLTIIVATFALSLTENGISHYGQAPVRFMDLFFEVVSAFATVGLSINLTPELSAPGKVILCVVMFIGKLGPVWLVTTIQQFQREAAYQYPEATLPVG